MRKLYFILTFVLVNLLSAQSYRAIAQNSTDSCAANFETQSASSTSLGKYFIAQPWNSGNKKPVYICWNFGDNHDTCIQYSNTSTGSYSVNHNYLERGQYEVCVRLFMREDANQKNVRLFKLEKLIVVGQILKEFPFHRPITLHSLITAHCFGILTIRNHNKFVGRLEMEKTPAFLMLKTIRVRI